MDLFCEEVLECLKWIFEEKERIRDKIEDVGENWKKINEEEKSEEGYQKILKNVEVFLESELRKIREKVLGEGEFLGNLLEMYDEFQRKMSYARLAMFFLDQEYLLVSGKKSFFEVGTALFAKVVFLSPSLPPSVSTTTCDQESTILGRISDILLGVIEKERNKEAVHEPRFILKNVLRMLSEISNECLYIPFESQLLKATERYYKNESKKIILQLEQLQQQKRMDDDPNYYLNRYLQRIGEERELSRRYLFYHLTFPKIQIILQNEFLEFNNEEDDNNNNNNNRRRRRITFKSESPIDCESMLKSWNLKELKKVYSTLTSRTSTTTEKKDDRDDDLLIQPLREVVKNYLREEGLKIVGCEIPKLGRIVEMINNLFQLHEKFETLQNVVFTTTTTTSDHGEKKNKLDQKLKEEVKEEFTRIIKTNQRLPEFLSLFLDSRLRPDIKIVHSDDEFDKLFDQTILLLEMVHDKDIFLKFLEKHLGRRLLSGRSQSFEAEKSLVRKLKCRFGFGFTRKCDGMLKDYHVYNKNIRDEFKEYCKETKKKMFLPVKFEPLVLTTSYWPISWSDARYSDGIELPLYISDVQNEFKKFYLSKTEGRSLRWVYSVGDAIVKLNGYRKPYSLECSTYQMIILQIFNNDKHLGKKKYLTVEEIQKISRIPGKEVMIALKALTQKFKRVLFRSKGDSFVRSTKIKPNEKFTSRTIRVKISNLRPKPQPCLPCPCCCGRYFQERNYLIDAAIVRIMKSRGRKVSIQEIVMGVQKFVENKFKPGISHVKKRIGSLIEREYLEKDNDNNNLFNYLA